MAALADFNYNTKIAAFSIDSAEELALLPTTHSAGNVSGIYDTITAGSIAYLTDGSYKTYTLDGSDNWNAEV